jgi:hypothetical protein
VETNLLAFLSGADVCTAMPRTANGMRPHRSRQAIIVPRLLTKPFAPSSRDLSLSVSLDEAIRRTIDWARTQPPEEFNPHKFDYAAEDSAAAVFHADSDRLSRKVVHVIQYC